MEKKSINTSYIIQSKNLILQKSADDYTFNQVAGDPGHPAHRTWTAKQTRGIRGIFIEPFHGQIRPFGVQTSNA